jgi:hypothetical protein
MTMLGFRPVGGRPVEQPAGGESLLRRVLLVCGILSSLLYVAMLVLVPLWWEGYGSADQAVSELSAIGAPTRSLWERISIGAWLLWVGVFAIALLRARRERPGTAAAGDRAVGQGEVGAGVAG